MRSPQKNMTSVSPPDPPTPRRYVKGERRYKHVSPNAEPQFRVSAGDPKKVVGMCPNDIPLSSCQEVLHRALPAWNTDGILQAPRRLYAFYRSILFEFRLSDHEREYHAFPLRGSMPRKYARQVRAGLESDSERRAFDRWLDEHVQVAG